MELEALKQSLSSLAINPYKIGNYSACRNLLIDIDFDEIGMSEF